MECTSASSGESAGVSRQFFGMLMDRVLLAQDVLLNDELTQRYLHHAARAIILVIEEDFLTRHPQHTHLVLDNLPALLAAFHQHIGGVLTVERRDDSVVRFLVRGCPWLTPDIPSLRVLLTGIYGGLAARRYGYARVAIDTAASAASAVGVTVFLHPVVRRRRAKAMNFSVKNLPVPGRPPSAK